MATEVQNRSEQSLSSLVSGIASDVQDLVKQQFQLTRHEIEEDLHKGKEAALFLALGAAVVFLGAIALCLTLVYLMHWLSSPAGTDPAVLPLWACHAIVGVVLVVIGGLVAYAGQQKMKSVNPLHSPATQALKENVQWLTTPK